MNTLVMLESPVDNDSPEQASPCSNASPDQVAQAADLVRLVCALVERSCRMDHRHLQAFVMVSLMGFSLTEVARKLGVSIETIRCRKNRVIRLLRDNSRFNEEYADNL